MVRLCLYLITCLFFASCANKTLIRDSEYQPVYQALQKQNASEALLNFPDKEQSGFITTFEKAWIQFWTSSEKFSDLDIQVIQNLSDEIEKRKFVSISHEATVFLVGESEDGYIPSEHEIISLHLFLAMLYLDKNKIDPAHVELKRAIEYLANNPEGKQTTFDDPAIRVWLAALWEAIGNRNESDVDLRKAMQLSEENLSPFVENKNRRVHLLMSGTGPQTEWSDNGETVLFKFAQPIEHPHSFVTNSWYQWHKKRNTNIRDTLLKSHYMTMALGHKTSNLSKKTAGIAASAALFAGAIVVVAAGVYTAIQIGGSSEALEGLFYVTLAGASWFVEKGEDVTKYVDKKVEESKQDQADLRKSYRMIRFLPSQIEYIDENLAKAKPRYYSGYRKTIGTGHNQVEFIWNPE